VHDTAQLEETASFIEQQCIGSDRNLAARLVAVVRALAGLF
jgi:hypothetical protein